MTWEGYAPDDLVNEFTKQTGIKVEVTYVSASEEIIGKLRATGASGYDIVHPPSHAIKGGVELNLYQPIDVSKLKIMSNYMGPILETTTAGTTFDGKLYALPFVYGSNGIIVNTDKIKKTSYSTIKDLFGEEACGRVETQFRYHIFHLVGYGLGYDVFKNYNDESKYRDMMEKVLAFLVSKKKCIKTFWTTRQENIDLLERGECWIAEGWDATGWFITSRHPNIKYVIPEEGATGWVDVHAIPAKAKNLEAAYKFINFVMMPEQAAKIAKATGYTMPVKGVTNYLSAAQKKIMDETFVPGALERIHFYPPTPSYVREIFTEMEQRFKQSK